MNRAETVAYAVGVGRAAARSAPGVFPSVNRTPRTGPEGWHNLLREFTFRGLNELALDFALTTTLSGKIEFRVQGTHQTQHGAYVDTAEQLSSLVFN